MSHTADAGNIAVFGKFWHLAGTVTRRAMLVPRLRSNLATSNTPLISLEFYSAIFCQEHFCEQNIW